MTAQTPARHGVSEGDPARISSSDLVAGAIFVAIGGVFALASLRHDLGTLLNMGPGYFPLVVSLVLLALGISTVVKAFVSPSTTEATSGEVENPDAVRDELVTALEEGVGAVERHMVTEQFGSIPWRALLFLTSGLVWFALSVAGAGLLPSAFGTVVLASLGRRGTTARQMLVTATALTALSWLIFVVGLQLRVQLLGPWFGG